VRKWKRVDTADGPRFRSQLPPHEAALLKKMVLSIQEMLNERNSAAPSDPLEQITGIRTGNTTPPEDATMRRLLPDFFRPEGNAQDRSADAVSLNSALRSLHEPAVIDAKSAAAQRVLETLPEDGSPFEITENDANAWIAAVNDIRLALGTMLGIGPDGPDELPAGHPMAGHLDVYQWLTVLQEYLVLSLMSKPSR
jgi:hypothetical protein